MDNETLLQAFQRLLAEAPEPPGEEIGLARLFTELAALRTEVHAEGRQAKQALELLRQSLETLERQCDHLEQAAELQRRQILEPILLELVDLRDRLAMGIDSLSRWRPNWFRRLLLGRELDRLETVVEGQRLTLERFDQWLLGLGLQPIDALGNPFEPERMRAAEIVHRADLDDETVVAELRRGYLWQGRVLRPAEVAVNRIDEPK